MKILFAGNYEYFFYEEVCAREMERLGHEVLRFTYRDFYRGFWGKLEQHFVFPGPQTRRLNRHLHRAAAKHRPDVVIIWRGTNVLASTLQKIKRDTGEVRLVSYVNDDPFGPKYQTGNRHQRRLWNLFRKTIAIFDQNYVFRALNIEEYKTAGAKHADLFLPYFIPEVFKNVPKPAKPAYDVVFIGHCEAERVEYIRYLIANGIRVKIYGAGWNEKELDYPYPEKISAIFGQDYYRALLNARVTLGFFSKLNRDEYTRRSFEIPGCGALLLCERTDAMRELFEAEREAVYFSSKEELLEKTKMLLADENLRLRIAAAGQERCRKSGYDVRSRVADWMERIASCSKP